MDRNEFLLRLENQCFWMMWNWYHRGFNNEETSRAFNGVINLLNKGNPQRWEEMIDKLPTEAGEYPMVD